MRSWASCLWVSASIRNMRNPQSLDLKYFDVERLADYMS
jgi:hypothetical protein